MKDECINAVNAAAGRTLSKAELDGIEGRIRGALQHLSATKEAEFMAMSPRERTIEAAKLAKEWMMKDSVAAFERSVLEASRKAKLFADVAAVKPGLKGQVQYLKNRLVQMEPKVDGIASTFFRMMSDVHKADGGKFFGLLQDPKKQGDIVRGLFGENTTPEAKGAADLLKQGLDALAERFKNAGLALNAREDYHTPQPQDPTLASKFGKDQWVADHMGWVDRKNYVNNDGTRMTDDQLKAMLEKSWESIATDGSNKRAEGEMAGGSALVGNNKNAPRQLHFKDSASWMAAMQKYGHSTNLYELISNHVKSMSRDIAMAEEFGRMADQNWTQALAKAHLADHDALGAGGDFSGLTKLKDHTQRLFDAYNHPGRPESPEAANLMAQLRGLMASSQLGSLFGALPDLAGLKMMADFNGTSSMRVFADVLKGIFSGEHGKEDMARMGLWMEGFSHMQRRMAEDGIRNGWGQMLNEVTHQAMGLNAFDRGMRTAVGRVVLRVLGKASRDHADVASADGEVKLLAGKGVTDDHFQVWKAADLENGMVTPSAIERISDPAITDQMKSAAIEKLMQVAYSEMQIGARGASASSLQDRVMLGMDKLPAGTVSGELWRFMTQFKSVPLGIFRAQYERAQSLDTLGSKTAYMAKFVASSMLLGGMAAQIKALINGQNPRDMNPETPEGRKFLFEAFAAGGGMGLYGDLFANGSTAYGSGPETLMGPGISAGWDLIRTVNQAREDASNGEAKHPYGLAALRWVRKNATPLANLWYTKAAFNRLVYDNLQEMLAPGSADKQRQRMEARGASYWWAPGENSPSQSPDFSKAWQ